jgi:glycosyltransferase involved in cell wall biosynthesis
MSAMHVCIVAPTANAVVPGCTLERTGGAEMQLWHLARSFSQLGASVTFIVDDYGQQPVEIVDGVTLRRCPFRYFGRSLRYYPADTWRLITMVRSLKPDVVLLKTPRTLTLPVALATRGLETQVVRIMAHDSDCDRRFMPPANTLYLLGARLMHGTVFQSQSQARLAGRLLGLKGRVIPNIAHGVASLDGRHSIRTNTGHSKDIDCLWVGTCTRNKAPLDFLEIVRAIPAARCTMIMAPGQDTALQAEVTAQAAGLANLDYLGFVPYANTSDYFERAKILVHTSRREGFPNVFLQAWEHSTTVVSMHVDPDGVIARHGLGKVSGSIGQVIADVSTLHADDSTYSAMRNKCKEYLLATHSPKVIIAQYLDYFKDLQVQGLSPLVRNLARES